jgi:hypothetical protein
MKNMIYIQFVNMMDLDLNLLRVVDMIATEGSVTVAGERIGLSQPAMSNALAHRAARFARGLAQHIFLGHGGHFQMDVDAVKQGPGNFAAIARHLVRRATAAAIEMPEIAAGTGTRCSFAIRAHHS